MAVIDVELLEESQSRYLTYALSVVHNRALPDVRDGLKPVQRRILYAMYENLRLLPEKPHRKSAAVVGEVLARFHPHGDDACYEAMVRMAQDFSLRYPLVEGQGNFGSLDGDGAAAYRYTEARLTRLALEVIGDIDDETVALRDNFDQTVKEPVVLPARLPNLLINGASGIAVGMATAIPPHNLTEVIDALLLLLGKEEATDTKLFGIIKGPDFPTACSVVNSKAEIREMYRTGRGAIRMRADYKVEKGGRGKEKIIITSVPYGTDKSQTVEKIADLIIQKKISQITDVRDESTDEVRIVLEISSAADAEKAMAFLFKNTPLQTTFHVNLTALIPTTNPYSGKPATLTLRDFLQHFLDFRLEVTRKKLLFEKSRLDARIHLLEGLVEIYDVLDEVIAIVRKSDGRADAAARLQTRFKITEIQALFIVDLRIYQLSRTSIEEINAELKEKRSRVKEIKRILKDEDALKGEVRSDLERIRTEFGDERRSKIVHDVEEVEVSAEEFVEHEDVFIIVTRDGWLKRIRQSNDPQGTRIREGDSLFFTGAASTKDILALVTNFGNLFGLRVFDLASTSGFGEPVQKMFRFQDGELIVGAIVVGHNEKNLAKKEILAFTENGLGFRTTGEILAETKKIGKKLVRVRDGDKLVGACMADKELVFLLSDEGYGLCFPLKEVPILGAPAKGVILQRPGKEGRVVAGACVERGSKVIVKVSGDATRELDVKEFSIAVRSQKGLKVVKRGLPVVGLAEVKHEKGQLTLLH